MGLDMNLYTKGGEGLIYWRKANAIHGWFVNECADGVDNCQEIKVSLEDLKVLLHTIEIVLNDKSEEKARAYLPPTPGFFFGSPEIDTYYWEELERTQERLKTIISQSTHGKSDDPNKESKLKTGKEEMNSFVYQSSW